MIYLQYKSSIILTIYHMPFSVEDAVTVNNYRDVRVILYILGGRLIQWVKMEPRILN